MSVSAEMRLSDDTKVAEPGAEAFDIYQKNSLINVNIELWQGLFLLGCCD
jgi:hypothetical protein